MAHDLWTVACLFIRRISGRSDYLSQNLRQWLSRCSARSTCTIGFSHRRSPQFSEPPLSRSLRSASCDGLRCGFSLSSRPSLAGASKLTRFSRPPIDTRCGSLDLSRSTRFQVHMNSFPALYFPLFGTQQRALRHSSHSIPSLCFATRFETSSLTSCVTYASTWRASPLARHPKTFIASIVFNIFNY